jgi:MoxR-like ATPase
LTLRDLEAVVFESLHLGIPLSEGGTRLLGYYSGEVLAVQTGILERIRNFLKPVAVQSEAALYLGGFPQARKRGLFFVGESGVGKTTLCMQAIQELRPSGFLVMSQSDAELWKDVEAVLHSAPQDLRHRLELEMQHFSQHQLRDKAVLVAAKCGLVLYIDEFNTDRNLRLEETLNQVMSSGSGGHVHPNFFVIATGNPSRFHGRLELPMSLQTRFTTVLLKPIDRNELKIIIQSKQNFLLGDDDAQMWVEAFFKAKESLPEVTTRALLSVLRSS